MEKLLKETQDSYYRLAKELTGNKQDAEDLLGDTQLILLESYNADVSPMLGRTIINNIWKNRLRDLSRNSIKRAVPFSKVHDIYVENLAVSYSCPYQEDFSRVLSYIQSELTGSDYTILMMRAFGEPYAAIAEKFSMPITTVRHRVYTIRKLLRNIFSDILHEI